MIEIQGSSLYKIYSCVETMIEIEFVCFMIKSKCGTLLGIAALQIELSPHLHFDMT